MVVGLLSTAVLTRALSLEQFGLYTLYFALVAIVARLTSFQTWQAQIHYGAHAKESENKQVIFCILFFGWQLDVAAGIVGFVVAVILGGAIPQVFGLLDNTLPEVMVAASILLFNWLCSPTAFFRLYGRFFPQVLHQNITSILQLFSVLTLWTLGENRLIIYLAVTSVNNIIGQLCFFIYALVEARKVQVVQFRVPSYRLLTESCPGIVRFVLMTNMDGTIRVLRELDIFVVNYFLDLQTTALYKIAKIINTAFGRLTGPFYQSIYPELARLAVAANANSMVLLMKQASMILGSITMVVWIGFLLLGQPFLTLAFGPEFSDAYFVSVYCTASMVVWAIAQPLSPVMMAMRKPGLSMTVHFFTSVFYILILTLLVSKIGLIGAGMALLSFYLLWSIVMFIVVAKQIKLNFAWT
jgi:O-antigen/teichoic acid export membrane protein